MVVVIKDVQEKTMEKLLEFIYTGKIEDMDGQLEKLLYAADKYEIPDLVSEHVSDQLILTCVFFQINLCNSTLSEKDVTPRNATKILLLADRHELCELKTVIYYNVFLSSRLF